ncbi:MAG: hypothetical protein ABL921_04705 [Pirellula sp.]
MQKQRVHEIPFGLIKACIWKNQTRSGAQQNVTVCRLFRNGVVWKEAMHFGRDDLPVQPLVIDLAYSWIFIHGGSEGE